MTHACYWTIDGVVAAAVGPPGQLGIAVQYCVSELLSNEFVLLADSSYSDSFTVNVDTPATNASIILAAESAIQARETGYPLLVFIPIVT
jgi:hypothetical protein